MSERRAPKHAHADENHAKQRGEERENITEAFSHSRLQRESVEIAVAHLPRFDPPNHNLRHALVSGRGVIPPSHIRTRKEKCLCPT
jgi:hypothetical protein